MNSPQLASEDRRGMSWPDWLERNRNEDRRGVQSRAWLTKAAVLLLLVLLFGRWDSTADYGVWIRFGVCAGAIRAAFLAIDGRQFGWAILFGGMALLYNPLVALLPLSGRLEAPLVLSSMAVFAVALVPARLSALVVPASGR